MLVVWAEETLYSHKGLLLSLGSLPLKLHTAFHAVSALQLQQGLYPRCLFSNYGHVTRYCTSESNLLPKVAHFSCKKVERQSHSGRVHHLNSFLSAAKRVLLKHCLFTCHIALLCSSQGRAEQKCDSEALLTRHYLVDAVVCFCLVRKSSEVFWR